MHRAVHPAELEWWHQRRQAASCGHWPVSATSASCGSGHGGHGWGGHGPGGSPQFGDGGEGEGDGGGGGGPFGVRRPLRFLAYKLELDDKQIAELARVLDELKTERAQAEVDRRRTVAALADAVAGEAFDVEKATEGAKLRVTSAERLRDAVIQALRQIHQTLDPDQRAKLAYLIRTGTLLI